MKIDFCLYRVTKVDKMIIGEAPRCMMRNDRQAPCGNKAAYGLCSRKMPSIYICGPHLKELKK